ncbi:maltose alpha-D-glucosyltransferase [Cyanobium sp. BA20m-p-22]|uniref:maltose alpha-D-glucosyltransferase n=1 Tax=Cyanobium sp. BA20m-p-22 TaxID=2823704 RepID=UPI0020CC3258|nr:maltose alpha-D-glucosyltransferase [Cyanobium sp. BA20m-p-22]MCP9910383.1 maltose alpha-D-glucosyltransferase [Cyanobium sp. BA20m-p-22]
MPIFPSPLRDDGYDVSDFLEIDPSIGSLADFQQLTEAAHQRDLRVITDLVISHTSDQHHWFQKARQGPDSPFFSYYVWSDSDDRYPEARVIFSDTEHSNWAWDHQAKRYYWHRFFSHQPDLNYDHLPVQEAILDVMRFWLDLGIDGFRVDAVPYLFEREGTNCENLPETHAFCRRMRRLIDGEYPGRILLAEANQWPDDLVAYFGEGDEFHMAFNFPLMPRLFLALRREDNRPLIDCIETLPAIPADCQWATFLRNHDELTLEMVTDADRDYLTSEYARDPRMMLNVGIRRRLAPLLDHDRRRIELLYSLLLSLPGAPVIYYGDEIGMGDNIYLGDRNGVRTPMQWSDDRNAGFSSADPSRLYKPVLTDPLDNYQAVNVAAQLRSPASLLHWLRHQLRLRSSQPVFSRGEIRFVQVSCRSIVAFTRSHRGTTALLVHNLAATVQPVHLELEAYAGLRPVHFSGNHGFPQIQAAPYFLNLAPYESLWFLLEPA